MLQCALNNAGIKVRAKCQLKCHSIVKCEVTPFTLWQTLSLRSGVIASKCQLKCAIQRLNPLFIDPTQLNRTKYQNITTRKQIKYKTK